MVKEEKNLYSKIVPASVLLGALAAYNYGPEIIECLNNIESFSCQGLVNLINSPEKNIASRVILGGIGAWGLGGIMHHLAGYLDDKRQERKRNAHNQELSQQHTWLYNATHGQKH